MRRGPTLVVAMIVLVVLFCYAFAFQVRFTETAVVTRFERPVDREVATGLNWRAMPWPIERVHKFDNRLRAYETQFTQLSTLDQHTVTVTSFATWRIPQRGAVQFLRAVGREEAAADKIGDLLKNAVSKVLKRHPLSALVNTDPAQIRYGDIEKEIRDAVQADAIKSYGIEVAMVGIARLGIPEKNTVAVAERMKSERRTVSTMLIAEGEAEARSITETAQAVASKILERARAYSVSLKGEAEAQAAQYYKTFQENPQLAAELKSWDALFRMMSTGENVMVIPAEKLQPFNLLMQDPAGGAATPAGRPNPPPVNDNKN